MPKDLIHFSVAEQTAKALGTTHLAAPLAKRPHGLLLGSIFHDVLFYAVPRKNNPIARLADALHGADGQDTFTLLRLQAEHAAKTRSHMAIALLVGMVSHIFADAVMHPMVWHFSGDYYSPDPKEKSRVRQRHRALESLMDMVACPHLLGRPAYSLRRLLRRAGTELYGALPMAGLAGLADIPEAEMQESLASAWRLYAWFQTAYAIAPLARTLHALSPWMPRPAAEVAALFYAPQLLRQKDRITNGFSYTHPVTGADQTTSLDQLMTDAAKQATELCQQWTKIPKTVGPSLDTGMPATGTKAMTRYANPPFPELTQSILCKTRLPESSN